MRRATSPLIALAILTALAAPGALAGEGALAADAGDEAAPAASKTCLVAEVNPVTGHTLCINPLGAPVEALPPSSELPCQPQRHAAGAWTYEPNCKS